jgi:two-component system NtrC family sensor kinase
MSSSKTSSAPAPSRPRGNGHAFDLRWRIILILLFVSICPLAVVGVGSGVVFGSMLEDKALELQSSMVRTHATTVDLYLAERVRALDLASRLFRAEDLADEANLHRLFEQVQASHDRSLVDLGVIDETGKHLAYVGPYDLKAKNYAGTPWFSNTMAQGSYVSDVFVGYRKVPHCVIAIRRDEGARHWILRATINSRQLDTLVTGGPSASGQAAFLVNREGLYQTSPPVGNVLDPSGLGAPEMHQGVRDHRVWLEGKEFVQVTAWVNDGHWMLVVRQDAETIRAPVRRALQRGAIFTGVAVLLLVGTTVWATRHLTRKIDRANEMRDRLSKELIRSSKLASVGELATGLAHEINNPLAIISSERTNVMDCLGELSISQAGREELTESMVRIGRQVERCAGITARMLKFGRNNESQPRRVKLADSVAEVVRMMDKQASVRNVALRSRVGAGLPDVVTDATELEQVLVNLVNNAMHAMPKGGAIDIEAHASGGEVLISVQDTGQGIAPENLERVFEPFFTTKPVGEGTGLGLSVCYGIVRGWGGQIRIESEVDVGTKVTLVVPAAPPSGEPSKQER